MRALDGVTVLDLTHMLSGPYATMLLADMGATTIKVEPPKTGEGTRVLLANNPDYSRNGMGAYFMTLNRNKKSVCIDLKSTRGLEVFYSLVKRADVVFDNFSAGVTQRLGIDHTKLNAINPRIITCSVTGFGADGPGSKRPAFDQVVQGIGGGMSITGYAGGEPLRAGIPIGDLGGGLFGAIGVLSALVARQKTGRGQHVDISMLDGQISLLNYMATMYSLSGTNPEPLGNGHFVHVPYNTFKTATGRIIIAVIFDSFWMKLVEMLGVPELKADKYRTQPGRYADRDYINKTIETTLMTKPAEYWLAKLEESRIPSAPVNNFEQALNDLQIRHRNMVVKVEVAEAGFVEMPGNPVKLSDTYDDIFTPPPALGRDTREVLSSLAHLSDGEIEELLSAGVIG